MKLTTQKLKKMIIKEMNSMYEMDYMNEEDYINEDQSMGAMYQDLEDRELFSYINMIKRDNPGISHEEAVEMAQDQMEADNMGMEPHDYAASERRGETMPVRESRKKRRKK